MTRTFTAPAKPDADPIPWLTDLWDRSGCFRMDPAEAIESLTRKTSGGIMTHRVSGSAAFEADASTVAAIVAATTSAVAALHADKSLYRATFDSAVSTAGTSYDQKLVVIGAKPLTDPALTNGQRAAIVAGASLHETGHINHSQAFGDAVDKVWPDDHPDKSLVESASNIGDDNRIEARQLDTYGGLVAALEAATWYFSRIQAEGLIAAGYPVPAPVFLDTIENRRRAFILALRVPWLGEWSGSETELDYLLGLRDRFIQTDSPKVHVDLVREAVEWIKTVPMAPANQPTEGDDGDESTEGGDMPSGKSKAKPDPKGQKQDKGEPKDADPESESEDSDDGDGDGSDGDGSDSDESDGDEGSGDSDSDESGDDSADGADGDGDSDGESRQDSQPKADQPKAGKNGPTQGAGGSTPVLPDADCTTEAMKADDASQRSAEIAVQEHAGSQKAIGRMRRYNGALVYEKRLVRFAAAHEVGNRVTASEADAVRAVDSATLAVDPTARQTLRLHGVRPKPDNSSALAEVMDSAKVGMGAPERFCRSGRLDRGRLHRVSQGDTRVFIRREASAPQSVRCYIVLDASGSMGGSRSQFAVQAGMDLAGAIEALPWAQGRVYAHTNDYRGTFVVPLWESGEPIDNVMDYMSIGKNGTPEGFALAFVCDDLLEDLHPSEKGLVIMVADGQPNDPGQVQSVVDYYRRKGLRVVSVSIASSLSGAMQRAMYGDDVIEYDANVQTFARNIAKVIGSSI